MTEFLEPMTKWDKIAGGTMLFLMLMFLVGF